MHYLIIENLLMNLWEKLYSYKKRLNFLLVFNLRSLFVKRESMNFFVEEISLLRCACFMCTENFGSFNVSTIYHSSDIYNLSIRHLKFPININQIELLLTLDRDMISAWHFHQVFIISRENYRRQYFDWWRHIAIWRTKIKNFTF